MSTNNRIIVSDLDYNQIRDNLKTFMTGQTQFSDYDFDGSALSVLIDVLAYNTHYSALYSNLAFNEMFLDSASKRSSLLSIANNYGYAPRSAASAKALLNIQNTDVASTAQIKNIQKWSSFTATLDSVQYLFWTITDYTAVKTAGVYQFNNVEVYEGIPQTQLFVCTADNQSFILPNANIDLSTLSLTVQQTSEQPEYRRYSKATDIVDLTADSEVYFVKELEDGSYQISFGRNNVGKPLLVGNIVSAQYIISSLDVANGATNFSYTAGTLGGTLAITTVSTSYGGAVKETADEIRYNVGQAFFDQNRAVTPSDYKAIIKRNYSNIDSISVWGGEDNDPPVYGKVFVAIKPSNSSYLTSTEKNYIKENILKPKSIVPIVSEFVDPSYIELDINTTVYYNKNLTSRSAAEIESAVTTTISTYRNTNLKKFDGIFRMSKFASSIDDTDQSILSSVTTFKAYVEVEPKYNVYGEYRLNLVNPVYNVQVPEEAFTSTNFYIDDTTNTYTLDDDGIGNIRLVNVVTDKNTRVIVNGSIGTVDYKAGLIKISNLRITNLVEPNFYFIIKTQSYDVVSVRNQIVDIPASRVKVSAIADVASSGSYLGGTNYTFTSSRN